MSRKPFGAGALPKRRGARPRGPRVKPRAWRPKAHATRLHADAAAFYAAQLAGEGTDAARTRAMLAGRAVPATRGGQLRARLRPAELDRPDRLPALPAAGPTPSWSTPGSGCAPAAAAWWTVPRPADVPGPRRRRAAHRGLSRPGANRGRGHPHVPQQPGD